MNRDDLIERAQRWGHKCDPECVTEAGQLIDEFIAALSPVLPDDISKITGVLRDPSKRLYQNEIEQTADLIERLARENEEWRKYYKDTTLPVIQKHIDDIARLESMLDRLAEDKFMYTDEVGAVAHDWVLEYHKRIEYAASHRSKDDE